LTVSADEAVWQAVVTHQDLVMSETLAVQFGSSGTVTTLPAGDGVVEATARAGASADGKKLSTLVRAALS